MALKPGSGVRVEELKRRLRKSCPNGWRSGWMGSWRRRACRPEIDQRVRGLKFSFEPADVVNEVMSFGSPTPIEVAVSGPDFAGPAPTPKRSSPVWS